MSDSSVSNEVSPVEELRREVAHLRQRVAELEAAGAADPQQSRARLVAFLENSPEAIFIKDQAGRYTDASASFLQLAGRSREEVIGKTDFDLFARDIATRFHEEDEEVRSTGTSRWFRESFTYGGHHLRFVTHKFPLPTGEVAGIGTNVTDRVAQAQLYDEVERRLRLALEGTGVAVYEQDIATGTGTWSESAFRILGIEPPEDLLGSYQLWRDSLHPDDLARAEEAHAEAEKHGGPWTLEHRIVRKDSGEVRWLSAYGQILTRGESRISTGAAVDITDRKLAQQRLEKQTRTLQTLNEIGAVVAGELNLDKIVQSVTDAGVELTGAQFGAFFYNLHAENGDVLTLYTLSGAARADFEQFPHPRATPVFKPTFDGTAIVRSDDITKDARYGHNEPHHGMPANHLPVRSYLAVPVKSRSGDVIGGLFFGHERPGIFTDTHEQLIVGIAPQAAVAMDNARLYREAQQEIERRKRAEAHQELLINELNHRVKNTLAIVQSLAMQSFRSSLSPEEGRSAFDARLKALSSAHNMLTRQNWEQATLQDAVQSAVEATAGDCQGRVHIGGPQVTLTPQTALSVAMAIHELSTNAIKYGALSNGDGQVSLSWNLHDAESACVLTIEWKESGGPAVEPPKVKGFGTRLLERGLSSEFSGGARLDFAPGGVICTMRVLMPRADT